MEKEKEKNNFKKLAALGVGIGIGTGLGILFAPKSGKETRKEIGDKLHEMRYKIETLDSKELREEFNKKIEEIETDLKNLDKEKVLEIAKTKSKQIQNKIDEFISLAKEKGNEAIVKSAESLRNNAINVTKRVLAKLEQKETK